MEKTQIRKAIQLAVVPRLEYEDSRYGILYALCDDGSIWWANIKDDLNWQLENPIPQTEI